MNSHFFKIFVFVVFFTIIGSSGTALASGFALIEQGVSGLGNAYAGGAAIAQDATTVFFNPAGMTKIPSQMETAVHIIVPSFKFKNEGSTHMSGAPLLGGNGGDAGTVKVAPNLYFVKKITDQFAFGIGINSPFGLMTEYDRGWVGRYHAVKSDLMILNVNPSLAYKFNEQFSIGAGLNVSYIKAELTNAVDFGTIGFGLPGLLPQGNDGFAKLKGDTWGAGWNVGLLYEFTKNTRVGISYRSKVSYTLKGDAEFSGVPASFQMVPALRTLFKNCDIEAKLTTPDSLSVSLFHSFNPQWAVMGDITWTNWSTFDELRIRFENPNQPNSVVTTDWKDVFRFSLGATFIPTKAWTFRFGTAYDQAPTPNERKTTPRIPDNDRFWLACGAGYNFTDNLMVNVGYAHLFIGDTKINKSVANPEDTLRGGLRGTYKGHVDIISAELKWVF